MCMGICQLAKGNNFHDFLFASMDDKTLLKWGLLLKEQICPLRVNPAEKIGNTKIGRVAVHSPLCVNTISV